MNGGGHGSRPWAPHALPLVVEGEALREALVPLLVVLVEVQPTAELVEVVIVVGSQHQQQGLDHVLEKNIKRSIFAF